MLVSDYDRFVQLTDRTAGQAKDERVEIAIFGLAAEIGSVIAAIKKRLLASDAAKNWNVANDEIVKELGDVVWYCFALARIVNEPKVVNIFMHDIANLKREIGGADARAERLRRVLDPAKRQEFLKAAESFPTRTRTMRFEDYQNIAFLTARTSDRTLVEVCLAVLSQLSAELFRRKLPPIELALNTAVADRPINDVLGEIAWHVAALASTYQLSLGKIAEENIGKVSQRYDRSSPTPLHDTRFSKSEQLPRRFEIAVVSVGKGRSRMYLDGRRLGDDLTDNAYEDDGYRFHDVMHLANAAKLGWSPVLRGLMGRKRRSDPRVDEVQDGARAKIVEEAVIKAIHSEGVRLATLRKPGSGRAEQRLFLNESEISNHFLDFVRNFVVGLEVDRNQSWEWEEAIVRGYDIFNQLRMEGQGTITVDLEARTIDFRPEVGIALAGRVAGLGSAVVAIPRPSGSHDAGAARNHEDARRALLKRAIVDALGLKSAGLYLRHFSVVEMDGGLVSVKAVGAVQAALWERRVVAFRTTISSDGDRLYCTVAAMADD